MPSVDRSELEPVPPPPPLEEMVSEFVAGFVVIETLAPATKVKVSASY